MYRVPSLEPEYLCIIYPPSLSQMFPLAEDTSFQRYLLPDGNERDVTDVNLTK
jgi:hypothetical protein